MQTNPGMQKLRECTSWERWLSVERTAGNSGEAECEEFEVRNEAGGKGLGHSGFVGHIRKFGLYSEDSRRATKSQPGSCHSSLF
jgi:hypothetical protein